MKSSGIRLKMLVVIAWLVAAPLGAGAQEAAPVPDYIIGAGDVLNISVWKDEALTRQVVVLPDGKIGFPLLSTL